MSAQHVEHDNACVVCGFAWPCAAARLETENERLRAAQAEALRRYERWCHAAPDMSVARVVEPLKDERVEQAGGGDSDELPYRR